MSRSLIQRLWVILSSRSRDKNQQEKTKADSHLAETPAAKDDPVNSAREAATMNGFKVTGDEEVVLPEDTVLIAGAGPVGLLLATVLSHYGVKSVLLERNMTTTRYVGFSTLIRSSDAETLDLRWPKMDLTNARSMEQFRRLGLADSLRAKGKTAHPHCCNGQTSLTKKFQHRCSQ